MRLSREEIKRRQATFRESDSGLLVPTQTCPRCTPLGQDKGRGEIFIPADGSTVPCSRCRGKGYIVKKSRY
jgi:hypothetical protein